MACTLSAVTVTMTFQPNTCGKIASRPITPPGEIPKACKISDLGFYPMINHHNLDQRLRRIVFLISTREIQAAKITINLLLRNLRHPEVTFMGLDVSEREQVFNQLYATLIELAMKRFDKAHNCVRDLHYAIMHPHA